MEHRLLLGGGEHLLPFARSCVTKLKKRGLPYVSQSFEVDGVSINVSIEPGHEYIRIEGGAYQLTMDSGVVDVYPIFGPNKYKPGIFLNTALSKEYTAGFTEATPKGKINPGESSRWQVAGIVRAQATGKNVKLRGLLPEGGVGSFRPQWVEIEPKTTPPGYAPSEEDGLVFSKKYVATFCPASIFTGKTRLYVQAMYGLPLYEYGSDGYTIVATNQPPGLADAEGACPALWIPSYVAPDDFKDSEYGVRNSYQDILLDTSSGVYLDADYNHWLININNARVWVYKLISSPTGEKMRKLLRPEADLAEDEWDRVEAYILAYSLPDGKYLQFPECEVPANYSMGYGWHWNWSGNTAVITSSSTYQLDEGVSEEVARNWGMKSTTYKIAVKQTTLPKPEGGYQNHTQKYAWGADLTTLKPAVKWAIGRLEICIVEPLWGTEHLVKSTPRYSAGAPAFTEAVFYSYYDKDTLRHCSVNSRVAPEVPEDWTYSERFVVVNTYGVKEVQGWTLGESGGFSDRKYTQVAHTMRRVTIGSFQTPEVTYGFTVRVDKQTVGEKSLHERQPVPASPVYGWGSYDLYGPGTYAPHGYPDENGVYATTFYGAPSVGSGYQIDGTWGTEMYEQTDLYHGSIQVVIPLYDSQAALVNYYYGQQKTKVGESRDYSANGVYSHAGGYFMSVTRYNLGDAYNVYAPSGGQIVLIASYPNTIVELTTYGWSIGEYSGGYNSFTATAINTTVEIPLDKGAKACVGGQVVDAVFTHLDEFVNQEVEEIGTTYRTVSSATGSAFQGQNIKESVGLVSSAAVPAFVGFA